MAKRPKPHLNCPSPIHPLFDLLRLRDFVRLVVGTIREQALGGGGIILRLDIIILSRPDNCSCAGAKGALEQQSLSLFLMGYPRTIKPIKAGQ